MQERIAINEHVVAARAEETFHKPKSRDPVITLGDNSTNYFYNSIQVRRLTNIYALKMEAAIP